MASDFSIRHTAHIIRKGGVIAYPTDTIYGLGCDPYNEEAVTRINLIKQRPANKQFILLAGHISQVEALITLDAQQVNTITQTTEPTSWVVDAGRNTPPWLVADNGSITIRLSTHSETQRLCKTLGHAIISTSANLSGKAPANNALQLHQRFHFVLDKILATNKMLRSKPSKIIRLRDKQVIRA